MTALAIFAVVVFGLNLIALVFALNEIGDLHSSIIELRGEVYRTPSHGEVREMIANAIAAHEKAEPADDKPPTIGEQITDDYGIKDDDGEVALAINLAVADAVKEAKSAANGSAV